MEQSATPPKRAHVIRRPTVTISPPLDPRPTVKAPAIDPSAVETSRLLTVTTADPRRHGILAGVVVAAALLVGFVVGRSTVNGSDAQAAPIKVIEVAPMAEAAPVAAPEPATETATETETEPEPEPETATEPATATATATEPATEAATATATETETETATEAAQVGASTTAPEAEAAVDRPARRSRRDRPLHRLHIRSTPHALVYVDGVPLGFSPVTARVKGFTPVQLTFERNGYQTGSTTLEVTEPTRTIDVQLLPER